MRKLRGTRFFKQIQFGDRPTERQGQSWGQDRSIAHIVGSPKWICLKSLVPLSFRIKWVVNCVIFLTPMSKKTKVGGQYRKIMITYPNPSEQNRISSHLKREFHIGLHINIYRSKYNIPIWDQASRCQAWFKSIEHTTHMNFDKLWN